MRKLTTLVSSAMVTIVSGSALLVAPTTGYSQALEEITVTARKVTESIQDIPLAITAMGEDEINRLGIKDLDKIVQQDTSVQFDQGFTPSDTRITIRGLSPTRGRPNAATLVDGIDVTSEAVSNAGGSTLINPRLLDVERIEIIKGPQSALYGRSAFAGAIQYVTKDPADVLSGEINVDANTEDAQDIRGSVSIPLTDTLGVLINGSAWNARGSYRNSATGDYIGGGDGLGGSVTFVWEPTDELKFKWRTEYSDDNFDPAPQVLLNEYNTLVDLGTSGELDDPRFGNFKKASNVAPGASNCNMRRGPTQSYQAAVDVPGSLGCTGLFGLVDETAANALSRFFRTEYAGGSTTLGRYNPNDPNFFNQYNKAVISQFEGKLPDADDLKVAISPNYSFGKGAYDKVNAEDFDGVEKEVFRTSLVAEWAFSDTLSFASYTGYVDSTVYESLDLSKSYVDDCSQDVGQLYLDPDPYTQADGDPNPDAANYAEAILENPGLTTSDLAAFAPCNVVDASGTYLGGDGVNDAVSGFVQNNKTDTTQFSQEVRGVWDVNDSTTFTSGLLYWTESVDQDAYNQVTLAGGPECYTFTVDNDASQTPGAANFLAIGSVKDECANTALNVAYWMDETYQGRLDQGGDLTTRDTDHYSWFGSLDFDITEKLGGRVEARFTREDNEVGGLVQNPCLDSSLTVGDPGCQLLTSPITTGYGGRPQGPSAVILCGLQGRCDRIGIIPTAAKYVTPPGWDPAVSGTYATEVAQGSYSWGEWGNQPMPGSRETLDKTDRFWAPRASLEYFWTDDVMTYFSWSRGIKPGGFSLLTTGAFGLQADLEGELGDGIDFDSERLDVWEIGAKTTLFDGRVRLNGAAYFQDFKDKQVTVQAVVGNTVGTKVENISGSEVWGFEFDATWQVSNHIRTSLGYTYLDTEYTDYTITTKSTGDIARIARGQSGDNCSTVVTPDESDLNGCVMTFNGNNLERSPKHAIAANVNYTNTLFDSGNDWYTELGWRYQDMRYVEAFNLAEFRAYNITDWRIGIIADTWEVTGFVDNVFDDDTIQSGGSNPGLVTGSFGIGITGQTSTGSPQVNAGPILDSDIYGNMPNPRIAGVRATFRFGN
jgi:outer membrane receptor protein involved in Fe transport